MKPNYKNWVPKGMIIGLGVGFAVSIVLWLVFSGLLSEGTLKNVLCVISALASIILLIVTIWMCTFDYDMAAMNNTEFKREYTLASGGPYCDCNYNHRG